MMIPTTAATAGAYFGGKKKRSKNKSKSKSKNIKRGRNKSRRKNKSRSSKKWGGASYVGSIQGDFINDDGRQLFRNPAGGIA